MFEQTVLKIIKIFTKRFVKRKIHKYKWNTVLKFRFSGITDALLNRQNAHRGNKT